MFNRKKVQPLPLEVLAAIWRGCETMAATAVPTYDGNGLGQAIPTVVYPDKDFMTVTEATQALEMHRKTITNLIGAGVINAKVRGAGVPSKITLYSHGWKEGRPKPDIRLKRKPAYLIPTPELKRFADSRMSRMRSPQFEYAAIVRLLMLFGCRYLEIGGLRWSELGDFDKTGKFVPSTTIRWLYIRTVLPDGKTRRIKSNHGKERDLVLYLPQAAIDIINTIERRPGRDMLFGIGPHGLVENADLKNQLDDIIAANEGTAAPARKPYARSRIRVHAAPDRPKGEESKIGRPALKWTLHQLRHSFTTHLSNLKFAPPYVIEAMTNHARRASGQEGTYNHALYPDQQQKALDAWANYIRNMADGVEVETSNVTSLFGRPAEIA
jgi:integrase